MLMSITNAIGVQYMALIIIAITMVVFLIDRMPISITALVSSIALALFGCMDYTKIYSGF